jgi:ferric-dicitrate binding protein FerR (iron transport regulator)
MNPPARRQLEAASIVMAAVAGEAPSEDLTRLNHWLRSDPGLAAFVTDLIEQESWLSWQGGSGTDLPSLDSVREAIAVCDAIAVNHETRRESLLRRRNVDRASWATAAAVFMAIGATLGAIGARWSAAPASDGLIAIGPGLTATDARYTAKFVDGAGCLWNSETTTTFVADEQLRTGESLNLIEGVAKLKVNWKGGEANLTLEGPASLVLTAERGASLSRGLITADVDSANGAFVLGTPNGQIEISGDAAIGVAARGSAVELHVFRGAAAFLTSWAAPSPTDERVTIHAGKSVTIANDADGHVALHHGVAQAQTFASRISMQSDGLPISQAYVAEILRGQPLLYWRFEEKDAKVVRNEASGDRYNGRVVGALRWIDEGNNRDVELGAGLTNEELHAYIATDEPLEADFSQGYSLEMWLKPSHYHWGAVTAFVGAPIQEGYANSHGLLFEIGGPVASPSAIEQPGRLRFLHRSPASDDLNKGTSCFSETPYELRKWQHVAAVKDGDQMRLYVNGKLAASGQDVSKLPRGLNLIVGQLDRTRTDRRFIGQIDELAFYPRALSAEEVQRRYGLVRPEAAPTADPRSI